MGHIGSEPSDSSPCRMIAQASNVMLAADEWCETGHTHAHKSKMANPSHFLGKFAVSILWKMNRSHAYAVLCSSYHLPTNELIILKFHIFMDGS